jgi:hypothetical protein
MTAKTIIAIAIALVTATSAGAQRWPRWDNPPGSAFQDRGIIEDQGSRPVLTPRGYRSARTPRSLRRFYW